MTQTSNKTRLPYSMIKEILLCGNFGVEKLQQMRAEHPFFAEMLSENSFWVAHSPRQLVKNNKPKSLLNALERRKSAYAALKGQLRRSGATSEAGAAVAGVSDKKLASISYDAMLDAARTCHFHSLVDLTCEVWGHENLREESMATISAALMKDGLFASTVVHNVERNGLIKVMDVARDQLSRREYQSLCQVAAKRQPVLVISDNGPLLKTYRGAPAEKDYALVEAAVSVEPYVFNFLQPHTRQQTQLIERLVAKAGFGVQHLNEDDRKNPAYVQRLYEAQLFREDYSFFSCLVKTQVASPEHLYGRLDRHQLLDAMGRDAYRHDRVLIREALQKDVFSMYWDQRELVLYDSEEIGPRQVPNIALLDALLTERDIPSAMRRSLYDRYARPYGLKTAALEKDYATWRAHGALFWAGTLLTVYVDPVIGALLLPWLLKALSWSNRNALWSVDDLVKPPWRRPVPPQTRTLSF